MAVSSHPASTRILTRDFFSRAAAEVARDLLGAHLVREFDGQRQVGRIIETEAYGGGWDSASHAAKGRTARTDPMFGPAGHAYVYLIYGRYELFNIVTEPDGEAGAVLIRALRPISGLSAMQARRRGRSDAELANGPGKLTRAMAITRAELNRHDLCSGERLWIEAGIAVPPTAIVSGPRVGVDYATPGDRDAALRFRFDQSAVAGSPGTA